MREILFRGKRVDNGEWVYGNLIEDKWGDDNGNTVYAILQDRVAPEIAALWTPVKVVPETVGQYTGLTDKNGKKIFEGDVIQYKTKYSFGPIYSYVVYCADADEYPAFDLKQHTYEKNGLQSAYRECLCEVIGNIYDNPEMLED